MKIEKNKLKSALNRLAPFTAKEIGSVLAPRLLVKASGGKFSLTGCSNGNIGNVFFDGDGNDEFEFVIAYKELFTATAMRGDCDLTVAENTVTITQGDSKVVLPIQSADEFPRESKAVVSGASVTVAGDYLKRLISKVSLATKERSPQLYKSGINLICTGDTLQAIATDGARIFRNKMDIMPAQPCQFNGVISPCAIKVIDSLGSESSVVIKMDKDAIAFESESMNAYLPLLACEFPSVGKFFGASVSNAHFVLDKMSVNESLDIFSHTDNKALNVSGSGMQVCFSTDNGVSVLEDKFMMKDSDGNDFKFSIDMDYFRDFFRNLHDGETELEFYVTNEIAPIEVRGESNFDAVIMPLHK